MASARKLKRLKRSAISNFLAGVSVSAAGGVVLHLPGRRKSIVLSRREALLTQAVLASLDLQAMPGSGLFPDSSFDLSSTICGIDIHA